MSVSKKHFIRHYTIIEVMMAMGIFLVMMTIMMQFFTSAQQIWNKSSKRNAIYADARVAMNLMTREIQCMLYKNNDTDGTGKYPFWYEWIDINLDGDDRSTNVNRTQVIKDYFIDNKDLPEYTTGNVYLTALNFISTTDLKPYDQGSDICEIRYVFEPFYFEGGTVSLENFRGGKLKRSCTASIDSSGNTDTNYDFEGKPLLKSTDTNYDAQRVYSIWSTSAGFNDVIKGVYSLRFTCYKWDGTNIGSLEAMNYSGNNIAGTAPVDGYTLATGTTAPVAIRIDMKLLDPEDLKRFAVAIANSNSKQIALYRRKIRTFSKVIYLGKLEN